MNIIRETYKKYGFWALDTPTIEYSDVLLAKTGGETEKQIYRFNKGDNDLSLRFDLSAPLAKYVAQKYNELSLMYDAENCHSSYSIIIGDDEINNGTWSIKNMKDGNKVLLRMKIY